MVSPSDSTLVAIRKKVRRLTASSSESSLATSDLDEYINTYYNQDFPYSVKIDQMRSVYTFFTEPNIDRYPLNVNFNQGLRSPIYFNGVEGLFYKDREQFFNLYPRLPTKLTPITGDGTTVTFNFTITTTPFLRNSVVLGATDTAGATIRVQDFGDGSLYLVEPQAQTSVPAITDTDSSGNAIPGMKNENTGDPGDAVYTVIGSVNYTTGAFSITFPTAPASGDITLYISHYEAARPYVLLFWNNEFVVRPVPDGVYKVEVESYLTPVEFMNTTDHPILNQWWQVIALGAAIKVLEDRQDFAGVKELVPLYDRQVSLALERQGVEEIGQRNSTIYSSTQAPYYDSYQGWY